MKALFSSLGALLCAGSLVSIAWAGPPGFACPPQAPSACGPGIYNMDPFGGLYGPSYYLQPGYPPFNGMPPGNMGAGGMPGGPPGQGPGGAPGAGEGAIAIFPTHPFARGPRDFFMYGD